jgi:flagellar basal-body rod protein FlgG
MSVTALHTASTGLSALNTALDVTANNLANVNTAGFKSSRVNFQDLLYIEKMQPGVENANGDQAPTGLYVGLGVKVAGTQLDFTQGTLVPGGDLDVAIQGNGFFRVLVQDNLGIGGFAYTRAGQFTKNADGELVMVNDQGRRLADDIDIPDDAISVTIGADGTVFVLTPGDTEPAAIGQIELAAFVNPPGLKQIGENLFVETAASGPPIIGQPGTENFGQLTQGRFEGSNVDPTRQLIDLIFTQRAYEMNSQTIRAADEALRIVAQLRR